LDVVVGHAFFLYLTHHRQIHTHIYINTRVQHTHTRNLYSKKASSYKKETFAQKKASSYKKPLLKKKQARTRKKPLLKKNPQPRVGKKQATSWHAAKTAKPMRCWHDKQTHDADALNPKQESREEGSAEGDPSGAAQVTGTAVVLMPSSTPHPMDR
jgi:hypothetical protein